MIWLDEGGEGSKREGEQNKRGTVEHHEALPPRVHGDGSKIGQLQHVTNNVCDERSPEGSGVNIQSGSINSKQKRVGHLKQQSNKPKLTHVVHMGERKHRRGEEQAHSGVLTAPYEQGLSSKHDLLQHGPSEVISQREVSDAGIRERVRGKRAAWGGDEMASIEEECERGGDCKSREARAVGDLL